MLWVTTWFWGQKYSALDVAKLASSTRRNLKQPHKFICFADRPLIIDGVDVRVFGDPRRLCKIPGCYIRLDTFSLEWQRENGFRAGDRIVWIDLDTVQVGPLDSVFDRAEPVVIFAGANRTNPCPFNGSLLMLRAGFHPEVWGDFTVQRAAQVPYFSLGFPDDQAWLAYKLPNAATWKAGSESGVYSFEKPGWPWEKGKAKLKACCQLLPAGARSVTFSGHRNVKDYLWLPWVKENWIV